MTRRPLADQMRTQTLAVLAGSLLMLGAGRASAGNNDIDFNFGVKVLF